jgi:hypothetical protein
MLQSEPKSSQTSLAVPEFFYPYAAGVVGGLLGGAAMTLVAIGYGFASGYGPWLPVNLIGATFVRQLQDLPIERLVYFNVNALLAGLVLHIALCITLGLLFSLLLPTFPGSPLIWSLTIGPGLWIIVSWLILPMVYPLMARHVDHTSFFVAHLVYGLILGGWIRHTPKIRA